MSTESDKATATRAPSQRTGSEEATAVRTVVMAPGVELDEQTEYALSQLRDRQEARLMAHNRTEMALRRASQPHLPPAPDGPAPTPIDTSRLHELVEWPAVEPLVEETRSPTDAFTMGEFRPVQTELRKEGGLGAENLSDGTHFFGARHWGGDDLIRFSVGATSHFVLPPESIPATSSGRLRSAPPADVRGTVFGQTGYYFPPFAADDKWCHCYRVTRHALWQLVGGQWRALGESVERETIVHLENVVQVGNQIVPMSGFMRMPSIDFGLVTRTEPVWAQVEIRFDVDLEGDARIEFSPQNNPANSVVVRAFGWWARPI